MWVAWHPTEGSGRNARMSTTARNLLPTTKQIIPRSDKTRRYHAPISVICNRKKLFVSEAIVLVLRATDLQECCLQDSQVTAVPHCFSFLYLQM